MFGTAPTTDVFSVLSRYKSWNQMVVQYVAYCFAEKTGYSKISSYTGNKMLMEHLYTQDLNHHF